MKTMKMLLSALCVLSVSSAVFAVEKNAKNSKKIKMVNTKTKAAKVISDEQYWSNTADELIAKEVKRQKLDNANLEIGAKNELLSAAISRLASELNRRKKSEKQLEISVEEMEM